MKTIKSIGAAVIIATTIFAYAVPKEEIGKITGKVTDKVTGEGIPGVSVQIVGTAMGAAATFDGTYVIFNVPAGTYSLLAQTIGYNSVQVDSVKVKAGKTTKINFELTPEATKVEDIVCAAERPKIDKYVTSSESRKSPDDVEHMPVTNVSDILRTTSGFVNQDARFHARGGRSGKSHTWSMGSKLKTVSEDIISIKMPFIIRHMILISKPRNTIASTKMNSWMLFPIPYQLSRSMLTPRHIPIHDVI